MKSIEDMAHNKPIPRIILYFIKPPEKDRWIPGDRYIRPLLRRIIRGKAIRGVEKVFINLSKSFEILNIPFITNLPFYQLKPDDVVIVLGQGKYSLMGYNKQNAIIAGIGLMTHPSEWPNLCLEYPVKKYLQHSAWTRNVYQPYFGENICELWFAGIESEKWKPDPIVKKTIDVLIYIKIHWEKDKVKVELVDPLLQILRTKNLNYHVITYGNYSENSYLRTLKSSKSMIFITEHESQGFACCEALATNIPVFAWNQGFCKDPNRFSWNDPVIHTSSVPFFDERCGMTFKDIEEFTTLIDNFIYNVNNNIYQPRKYILENLTLEKSGERMLEIIREVYQ